MGETFTLIFKNGEKIDIHYPNDAANPWKMRKMSELGKVGNVVSIIGDGKVAKILREKYGLAEKGLPSDLSRDEIIGIVGSSTGLSKENIVRKFDELKKKIVSK